MPDDVYEAAAADFDDGELGNLMGVIIAINAWNRVGVATALQPPELGMIPADLSWHGEGYPELRDGPPWVMEEMIARRGGARRSRSPRRPAARRASPPPSRGPRAPASRSS